MTTRDMEKAILYHRSGIGWYHFWEIQIPGTKERVDMVEYLPPHNRQENKAFEFPSGGEWNFYELKLTLSDFYNGRPCKWRGNRNYLVCPEEVYKGLSADDIPSYVGVYVVNVIETDDVHCFRYRFTCDCVKKAKLVDSDCPGMMWACFKAGSRAFDSLKLG